MGHTELANLVLVIIATFTAVVTSRTMVGEAGAVFHPIKFVITSYWELLQLRLDGRAAGLRGRDATSAFSMRLGRFIRALHYPQWAKLLAGLFVVGVIAIVLPQNLSDGYPYIDHGDERRARTVAARCRWPSRNSSPARSRWIAARRAECSGRSSLSARWRRRVSRSLAFACCRISPGPSRIVRAGRPRIVSRRRHACAADRAVSAVRDDPAQLYCRLARR